MEASGTSLHCEEISNDTNSQKDNINKKIIIVVIMITIQQNEKKKKGVKRQKEKEKRGYSYLPYHTYKIE